MTGGTKSTLSSSLPIAIVVVRPMATKNFHV